MVLKWEFGHKIEVVFVMGARDGRLPAISNQAALDIIIITVILGGGGVNNFNGYF